MDSTYISCQSYSEEQLHSVDSRRYRRQAQEFTPIEALQSRAGRRLDAYRTVLQTQSSWPFLTSILAYLLQHRRQSLIFAIACLLR